MIVAAPLLWRESRYALAATLVTFGAHGVVMLVLQTAYREVVASDSIDAMTVRLAVWTVVLVLSFLHLRRRQTVSA